MNRDEVNLYRLKNEYESLIIHSIEKLLFKDYELLLNNSHEITISNLLARYMEEIVLLKPNFLCIDLEYNRMVSKNKDDYSKDEVSKAIYITSFEKDRTDLHNQIKRYVRPDIIVHRRGTNTDNILWLELKINEPERNCDFDKQKAWYAISQLQYKLGISILIDIKRKIIVFYWVYLKKIERLEFSIIDGLLKETSKVVDEYQPT